MNYGRLLGFRLLVAEDKVPNLLYSLQIRTGFAVAFTFQLSCW